MNRIQADRLLELARFLREKVPEDHFDMTWFTNQDGKVDLWSCGTTACALGWATAVFPTEFHFTTDRLIQHAECYQEQTVNYSGEFFGIVVSDELDEEDEPCDEWSYLFGQHERTPKEEAEIIERFVASRVLE